MALSCNPIYLGGYRTVGWHETESSLPPGGKISVTVLWPPLLLGEGLLYLGGQAPVRREGLIAIEGSCGHKFKSQPEISIIARLSYQYCIGIKNLIKNPKKEKIFFIPIVFCLKTKNCNCVHLQEVCTLYIVHCTLKYQKMLQTISLNISKCNSPKCHFLYFSNLLEIGSLDWKMLGQRKVLYLSLQPTKWKYFNFLAVCTQYYSKVTLVHFIVWVYSVLYNTSCAFTIQISG